MQNVALDYPPHKIQKNPLQMRFVIFCALCHSNLILKIILKQLNYLHLKIS